MISLKVPVDFFRLLQVRSWDSMQLLTSLVKQHGAGGGPKVGPRSIVTFKVISRSLKVTGWLPPTPPCGNVWKMPLSSLTSAKDQRRKDVKINSKTRFIKIYECGLIRNRYIYICFPQMQRKCCQIKLYSSYDYTDFLQLASANVTW